ncbi:MAG: hypothetical protein QM531_00700 [Candidatus Pacebacteria bacterium]|nr:hypothetical protein [Candidatus Paceibacterota bacterium]
MNHSKLLKLTLDVVSTPICGRRLLKAMKTLAVIVPALTFAINATAGDRPPPWQAIEPMRKYGGTQLVKVKERDATLDEVRAYGDLARRVPAHLISEVSCYMPDYFKEFFINGKKMPGAPFPSAYCWDRFYADVNAGKKVPLHMRYIDNYNKAQEKFFKDNPGSRPEPIPEKDKFDQQTGKTNAGTKADTTDTNTKKEEVK